MSNSNLVNYTKLSPNHSGARTHKIDTITPHHMAGDASIEDLGDCFADPAREASSNYGIGTDGRIALYVEEANRAWTSGGDNDERAVTIEVANDGGDPDWHVSDAALEALIELCVDICKRNGKKKLLWLGDRETTLAYEPAADEMRLTMHKWFEPTLCPGPYLESKFPYIAEEVNKRLNEQDKLYRVQVGAFRSRDNAEDYMARVQAAGFPAFIVEVGAEQTEAAPAKKTNEEIAREVIRGEWGNDPERRERLTAAGYDYAAIQKIVDNMYKK